MKNSQNITIVLLVVTATILTAMLLTGLYDGEPAHAGNSATRANEYIAVPAAISKSYEVVYVADLVASKMNIYMVDKNTDQIRVLETVDLKRIFEAQP